MRNVTSILQAVAIAVVCTLLGAKFPSLMSQETGISFYGGLAGGGIAALAISIARLFSAPVRNVEESESASSLFPLRAATLAFAVTVVGFTAYLYTELDWLLVFIRGAVVIGVISVFAGVAMAWKNGKSDV